MHIKRWLTGIVALPVLIFLIGPGPRWLFYALLCCASLTGLTEFYRMAGTATRRSIRRITYLMTFLLFAVIYQRQVLLLPAIIVSWALVPMALQMLAGPEPDEHGMTQIAQAVFGPAYVSLPLAMLMHIDIFYPHGNLWIFFLLTVVFAGDTGAFYIGKLFGKHKLYAKMSPGKTWEGAVGGLIGSLIAGMLFLQIVGQSTVGWRTILLALSVSIAGQIGDLAESMLKRAHRVKDSGNILPGHGGLLDRIDGLLFAAPILYIFLALNIVGAWPA
jgi:phosphatidate cytidylyltransferase